MIETLNLIMAFVSGVLLGIFFFAGLWWTVRKINSSQHPVVLFMSSLLIRMTVTVAGFYFVSGGHWQRLVISLVGFMIARAIVTQFTKAKPIRTYIPEVTGNASQS